MALLDLPDDVLAITLSFLQPRDYLAFCQVSKSVYSEYRQDSLYWRTQTSQAFRLPISPLLAADGPRWYWLYKRLKTQTRLYTWGQGLTGSLGPGRALSVPRRHNPPVVPRVLPHIPARPPHLRLPPRQTFQRVSSSWPTETHVPDEVGVISDLQCGGWSTTILSSAGKLYTTGSINSLNGITRGRPSDHFVPLEYLTQSTSAVRHFSAGRGHVLALTDDAEILSWDRSSAKGLKVFSRSGRDFGGKPTRVVAGWADSSAYVPEKGIVYWSPVQNSHQDEMLDGVHVPEKIIPQTARRRTDTGFVDVVKHVVLEGYIVWITSDSKIYACSLDVVHAEQSEPSAPPFEVPGFGAPDRELKDIQGQFRSFGVFTASGEILAGDTTYLNRCAEAIRNNRGLIESGDWSTVTALLASRPRDVPALQHTSVIALAYGDWSYHALHADGRITSYGKDPQSCGVLGLSGLQTGGRFRALRQERPGVRSDAALLPIAELRGRQIWFEPEKKDWLAWMEDQLNERHFNGDDGRPAHQAWDDDANKQAAFSEWVEQEGRHWQEGPATAPSLAGDTAVVQKRNAAVGDYANLGAYFPIAIAAAGWHSGALVLMDEDMAHETRSRWLVTKGRDEADEEEQTLSMPGAFDNLDLRHGEEEDYVWKTEGFPKVRLPDGFQMPGHGDPRPWRDGVPTMQELGLG